MSFWALFQRWRLVCSIVASLPHLSSNQMQASLLNYRQNCRFITSSRHCLSAGHVGEEYSAGWSLSGTSLSLRAAITADSISFRGRWISKRTTPCWLVPYRPYWGCQTRVEYNSVVVCRVPLVFPWWFISLCKNRGIGGDWYCIFSTMGLQVMQY